MPRRKRRSAAAVIPLIALCCLLIVLAFAYSSLSTTNSTSEASSKATELSSRSPSPPEPEINKLSAHSSYQESILPLLENYCYNCHMDGSTEGDLDLDSFTSLDSMITNRETWKNIKEHINWKLMPPVDKKQPTQQEREKISQWIDDRLFHTDPNNPDPGPINSRRLNRIEFSNTIRDLLFVNTDLKTLLPADDAGDGFDNNASSLTIAPSHVEKYLIATEQALAAAFPVEALDPNPISTNLNRLNWRSYHRDYYPFFTNHSISVLPKSISEQSYHIDITASQHVSGDENAKLRIKHNGIILKTLNIANPFPKEQKYRLSHIKIKPSDTLTIAFINDKYITEPKQDRNAILHSVQFTPVETTIDRLKTPFQKKYQLIQKKQETETQFATRVLAQFSQAALRANLSADQVSPYLHFIHKAKQDNTSVYHGIRLAMQAMLLSPQFLFIDTPHWHQDYAQTDQSETIHKALISEQTLASRLAYFIWSSTPDQELLDLAARKQLRSNLTKQIDRMLSSPKAQALVDNFAGQWLQTRDLQIKNPDPDTFPDLSEIDLTNIQQETNYMLQHILLENKPITDLIFADYSFMNENLAKYYSIGGIKGDYFRKVSLRNTSRRGILTHASILMLTSTPTRTSPVLRGKWLLENILGTSPPPPPPEVDSLQESTENSAHLSLREELELHREKAECAACHKMMDPIGFAFESFNAIGKYRKTPTSDTKGELFTGESFNNVLDLQELIATEKTVQFATTLSKKLLTYALARELEYFDKTAIESIVSELKNKQYKFHSAIHAVVNTPAFQYHRSNN